MTEKNTDTEQTLEKIVNEATFCSEAQTIKAFNLGVIHGLNASIAMLDKIFENYEQIEQIELRTLVKHLKYGQEKFLNEYKNALK